VTGQDEWRVAFIRAIGPITHKVMPLADLCKEFEKHGLNQTRSFLATGNILFLSDKSAIDCKAAAEIAIRKFGISLEVFIRSANELARVVAKCPFIEEAKERPSQLLVFFFDDELPREMLTKLLNWDGPETVHADERTLYVDYANGVGRSKLDPYRLLKLKGTARNWNTVGKMMDMLLRASE
jgi:uncharacterized protein (DUF1697 family)